MTTLTFVLMDPPYETARSTTAMRLIEIATKRGYKVNVFAYEGATCLPFAKQMPHANSVHGRDVQEEHHPNPKDWVLALIRQAEQNGGKLDWINCGLCVDERGVGECVEGIRRGGPPGLHLFVEESDNTLIIPTK